MKVYLISIDTREGYGRGPLGPYKTRAGALKALKDFVEDNYQPESIRHCIKEFGSDVDKGVFHSEEETLEVIERDLED